MAAVVCFFVYYSIINSKGKKTKEKKKKYKRCVIPAIAEPCLKQTIAHGRSRSLRNVLYTILKKCLIIEHVEGCVYTWACASESVIFSNGETQARRFPPTQRSLFLYLIQMGSTPAKSRYSPQVSQKYNIQFVSNNITTDVGMFEGRYTYM